MLSSVLADLVLLVHLAFIAFVMFGSLLAVRRPALLWPQLAAVAWAAGIEFGGWICPLTRLENALRHAAGRAGYADGFVAHYLLALIYPAGLTRPIQIALGVGVLLLNCAAYLALWKRGHVGGGPAGRR